MSDNRKALIIVPEVLIKKANALSLAIGTSPADDQTFRETSSNEVFDENGVRYIYTTPVMAETLIQGLVSQSPDSSVDVSDYSRIDASELGELVRQYLNVGGNISSDTITVKVYPTDAPIANLQSDLESLGAYAEKPEIEEDDEFDL